MHNDNKTRAWQVYRDFHDRGIDALTEDEFSKVWDGLAPYVQAVIKGKSYSCSDFDLDDYMAEAQFMLWQRMCHRKLPAQDPAIFIGAVKVMTRQMVIDCHRKNQAQERIRGGYAGQSDISMECGQLERLGAAEMLKKHMTMIARLVVQRSRFKEVNLKLANQIVMLLQKESPLKHVLDVIERTGFWDAKFLLEHLQVLYRWSYYEVREQTLGMVA